MSAARLGAEEAQAPLYGVVILTVIALLVASSPNLFDPIVRHDDFPALLAAPDGYYIKTLEEGRWINYLWHLRGITPPAWVNFALYQILWAVFAAALAITALGRQAHPLYVTALAIFIVVAPTALMISLWFNTLIPGMALIALYAVLACYLSLRTMRWLLVLFVPLTLMAYTTYPLFLLAVCMMHRDTQRSFGDLFKLATGFVLCFALGLLVIYSLNWQFHDTFGVVMAEWREPSPATDLASLIGNLPALGETAMLFLRKSTFEFMPAAYFHGALLIAATVFVARKDFWLAAYLWVGLLMGIGLIVLQVLKTGVVVHGRANIFVWVFYALIVGHAVVIAAQFADLKARLLKNAMLLVALSYLVQTGVVYTIFREWQADTRLRAEEISDQSGVIYVEGDYRAIPSAEEAGIQHLRGLYARLHYLTGRDIVVCGAPDVTCPSSAQADRLAPVDILRFADDTMIVLGHVEVAENEQAD